MESSTPSGVGVGSWEVSEIDAWTKCSWHSPFAFFDCRRVRAATSARIGAAVEMAPLSGERLSSLSAISANFWLRHWRPPKTWAVQALPESYYGFVPADGGIMGRSSHLRMRLPTPRRRAKLTAGVAGVNKRSGCGRRVVRPRRHPRTLLICVVRSTGGCKPHPPRSAAPSVCRQFRESCAGNTPRLSTIALKLV